MSVSARFSPSVRTGLASVAAGILLATSADAVAAMPEPELGAAADQLSPELTEELLAAPADASIRALFSFHDNLPARLLASQLRARGVTERGALARELGRTLRAHSAAVQKPMIHAIDTWQGPGSITHFESFWINNMLLVEGSPAAITALAARPEVAAVDADLPIELIRPVSSAPASPNSVGGTEYGLRQIKAPELWAMGITGVGSVVCNLDTGVRYLHPAITVRWRGFEPGVEAGTAWFDALGGKPLPYDNDVLSPTHGSHTMGTMTGLDPATADTIGVAFGAHWIAAKVFNRYGSGSEAGVIRAFQWAADPDDNPMTYTDVPTVISNSWGFFEPCSQVFWEVIDVCEEMGAAVVFAAGNEGNVGPRSPADRITTELNTFSTGATDRNENIASFSSRGPSPCDHQTIKPEVAAPGVDVRSIRKDDGYGTMSGTSMACPHVAGALALLRQVDPGASVEQLKAALYLSARDKGTPGEDNTFGRGIIDLPAAAALLGTAPTVDLSLALDPATVRVGDPLLADATVENLLSEPNEVQVWVTVTGAAGSFAPPESRWMLSLEAGESVDFSRTVEVPPMPAGDYAMEIHAGVYPFARSSAGALFTVVH